ncbi:hypothetical protein XFF6166_850002 [Xanthomonas citri pv. fuscans]|nr:hypothetical protein XFF6166_850002 [Xanthomonas citri pv. fuscans]SOO04459.1 hypothetical protein XFF6960_990005 [Xanthomonas citri pv. fuscans]SOO13178.1 hypothetical protein XFF7766_1220004 [Xanthomonas citri pv. fuscans]SOO46054.1 hypothetical protein XFF1815_950003 [Xanthomonas citri pv. fuscans]
MSLRSSLTALLSFPEGASCWQAARIKSPKAKKQPNTFFSNIKNLAYVRHPMHFQLPPIHHEQEYLDKQRFNIS